METKQFDLGTVLSVTTGRLLTKSKKNTNGIEDMYDLLGWMTNDQPFTHQLGRFAEECKPWLLRWFPELTEIDPDVVKMCEELHGSKEEIVAAVDEIVQKMAVRIGKAKLDIPRIPADDHERKNPIQELIETRGSDEGIIVVERNQ